ncbi:DUF2914 domain-containing protein [Elusimicrobiota bacterium]
MEKMTIFCLLAVLCLGNSSAVEAAKGDGRIIVEKIAIGSGVENNKIVGESVDFDASAERVWCWTKIASQKLPTVIKHIWYFEDKKSAEVPLNTKYPSHRTWSSKAVKPGRWKVEVVDEMGEVIASSGFNVRGHVEPGTIKAGILEKGIDATGPIQVAKMAVAIEIKDKDPVGESAELDSAVKRVWCWNKILAKSFPVTVRHVWYADKKKAGEVSLKIKAQSYRTWSNKTVWPGEWKVEVVSEDGKLLAARNFTVRQ